MNLCSSKKLLPFIILFNMIVKRKYIVTVFDDKTDLPVDYCFSNTLNGCLDYLRHSCRFYKNDLDIFTFKIQIIYD